MRVLAVGNMYPPHHLGGYEVTWYAAMRSLRERGHAVRVLTTDYASDVPDPAIAEDPDVHRELRWYWRNHEFPRLGARERLRLERQNAATFDRHVAEHAPDVVAWWAMGGMSLSLIERARRSGLAAAGFVIDDWMLYGPQVDAWLRMCRRAGRVAFAFERLSGVPARVALGAAARWAFVSETTRSRALESGLELPRTEVVHIGIDHALFREAPAAPWDGRLLYCGRIDERKGIDLAVTALAALPGTTLTLAGGGDERYLAELHGMATELGVEHRVRVLRPARDELPALYATADALLFPVRWMEPWGLVPLEAMAVGTPVIATGRGGSGEYLRDGENALLFDADGGGRALAAAVERLANDDELRGRLRAGGLATAARFDADVYGGQVERVLLEEAERR